jgi:hypothetical protein
MEEVAQLFLRDELPNGRPEIGEGWSGLREDGLSG